MYVLHASIKFCLVESISKLSMTELNSFNIHLFEIGFGALKFVSRLTIINSSRTLTVARK